MPLLMILLTISTCFSNITSQRFTNMSKFREIHAYKKDVWPQRMQNSQAALLGGQYLHHNMPISHCELTQKYKYLQVDNGHNSDCPVRSISCKTELKFPRISASCKKILFREIANHCLSSRVTGSTRASSAFWNTWNS